MTPERFADIITRYHTTEDRDVADLIEYVFNLRDEIAGSQCAFNRIVRALADERNAYDRVVERRNELIEEVQAAEKAASDYRNLLLDSKAFGEISPERAAARSDLDTRHAAVLETNE